MCYNITVLIHIVQTDGDADGKIKKANLRKAKYLYERRNGVLYEINLQSGIPIYDQLMKMILSRILSGLLKPGDKLPSVRILAKEVGINPNTVSKTYKELEHENIIYSIPGKGSFVSDIGIEKMEHYLLNEFDEQIRIALKIGFSKETLKSRIDEL